MKTFLIFFAFSGSAHQNEWENAQGGVIFKLFAYWATLVFHKFRESAPNQILIFGEPSSRVGVRKKKK